MRTGGCSPRSLLWEDGHEYGIDKVLDVKPAFAPRAGGQGDRYRVRIGDRESCSTLNTIQKPAIRSPIGGLWNGGVRRMHSFVAQCKSGFGTFLEQ